MSVSVDTPLAPGGDEGMHEGSNFMEPQLLEELSSRNKLHRERALARLEQLLRTAKQSREPDDRTAITVLNWAFAGLRDSPDDSLGAMEALRVLCRCAPDVLCPVDDVEKQRQLLESLLRGALSRELRVRDSAGQLITELCTYAAAAATEDRGGGKAQTSNSPIRTR
eukprot:GHVU01049962.1.p1 GENE.GHVU01049962.1~~GHVU01049962.1.p1  ORF type:complete len:167 (+),score=23.74 GHVU01049962.1:79-579(+)